MGLMGYHALAHSNWSEPEGDAAVSDAASGGAETLARVVVVIVLRTAAARGEAEARGRSAAGIAANPLKRAATTPLLLLHTVLLVEPRRVSDEI